MLTVETALFDSICWFSSSHDRKGQSYPVEYYLESVEEYSEGKIHKSEREPGNGIVNTVHFVYQARGNTRISPMKFVYNEWARDCKCLIYLSFLLRMFVKNILLQTSFYAQTLQVNVKIFSTKFEGWCKYFSPIN